MMGSLLSPDFRDQGQTVIFLGRAWPGKTLAIALAYRAIQNALRPLHDRGSSDRRACRREQQGSVCRHCSTATSRRTVAGARRSRLPHLRLERSDVLYHVVTARTSASAQWSLHDDKAPANWGNVLHDEISAWAIVRPDSRTWPSTQARRTLDPEQARSTFNLQDSDAYPLSNRP